MNEERWRKAKAIYQSLVDRGPLEREAFLAQACAGDIMLRKEVESLMACRSEADGLMSSPALEVAARELAGEPEEDLSGRTVLHYRVKEKIGGGGMGIVYRAGDTRLNREVAIKALPAIFSADPERLARFEREARLLATLSHPNIAAIYGLEECEGKRYIVMELAAGQTLAERIAKGPLPIEEALETCRQIAEGLEAAHEKGIVHRDLKPANVKITPEGKVKILDFGLAKAFEQDTPAVDASKSPTLTDRITRPGLILGTAAYMAPEQAQGKTVDKRADIWAFGCVLYECLTGKRPFQGDTVTETLASILKGEPNWQALPSDSPLKARDLLRRCLQKDPRERLHDIADARIEIRELSARPEVQARVSRQSSFTWLSAGVAVGLFAGIMIAIGLIRYFQPGPSAAIVTSTIKVEPGHWLDGMRRDFEMQRPARTAMAISSDGRFVVYSAIEENPGPQAKPRLFLRYLDQSETKPISGTEGGINPFLSPDNRWVGFWAEKKLKKVPIEGGVAAELCDARPMYGADWDSANSIVFATEGGLFLVSTDGGKPEPLTKPDRKRGESGHRLPHMLPNGKAVLFSVMKGGFDPHPSLSLLRLDTREWHPLLPDAADARYVPTGHIVFLKQGVLTAVRFDQARLEIVGQPFPLVGNVMQAFSTVTPNNSGAGQFALSDSGSLIYAAGGIMPDLQNTLVWVDQKGNEQPVTDKKFPYFAPRLSPDGRKIAYATGGREWQIWVYDINKGTNYQLTNEGWACYPVWTPDGKSLLFVWERSLMMRLFGQSCDGSSPAEKITTSEYAQFAGSYPPDGTTITVVEYHAKTGDDIAVLDTRTGRETPFLNSPSGEQHPEFSPDRRWIAYASNESGRFEVYVQDFPDRHFKIAVSSEGGLEPLWARNGKQIFYRWADQVWTAGVQSEGGFAVGKPRMLFENPGHYDRGAKIRAYDLSLDGQRFLMTRLEQRKPTPVTEMTLVQNWFEELKRLDPAGKK